MNENHDRQGSTMEAPRLGTFRFEFSDPSARSVCLAGTFNNWQPETQPMYHWGHGRWIREAVLSPGIYEYCLVVDGNWRADPHAKETVPNHRGGLSSVLRIKEQIQ